MTEDGMFTLHEEECLGACDEAPIVQVNFVNYDRVTEDGVERLIEAIRSGDIPAPSRGAAPPDFKQTSRILAGLDEARG